MQFCQNKQCATKQEAGKVCHHPGCTETNKNRPLLLCKECDKSIHSDPEFSGHLVLDAPKKRSAHPMLARGTSSPNLFKQETPHSDTELTNQECDEGVDTDDVDGIYIKKPRQSESGFRIPDRQESKLKRKKAIKSKRRHTDEITRESLGDEFPYMDSVFYTDDADDQVSCRQNDKHQVNQDHSIKPSESGPGRPECSHHELDFGQRASRKQSKSAINNDEYFTVKFTDIDEEDIVIVAATKGVCLQAVLQPVLERKKVDIERINIFVEASKTPLPLTCEAFLLGGNTLHIKKKENDGKPPIATRPSSAKSLNVTKTPKPAGGSLRGRRGINLSVDEGSNLMPSISPQGTLTFSEGKRIKNQNILTSLFSPLVRDREKQEQLSDLLNNYSANGIPSMPKLLTLGRPQFDDSIFELEPHWSSIVENASSLTKRQHDQQEAIWELLTTEVSYIKSLKVVTDLFMCCILNLQEESLLLEIEMDSLFSNLSDLLVVNSDFWENHLTAVLKESRETRKPLSPSFLKEGFKQFHKMFLPYTKYCLEQKACAEYLKTKYSENELFKTFVVWAEAQKQFNRLGLQEFLAKPFKRLTIYSLLLQAILRKTDDDRQRKDLLEMIGSVDRFVSFVNATLRQRHEQERLTVILRKIESYDAVESPNDESVKFLHEYNSNFDLTTPMPGCGNHQTRVLVLQSALRLKDVKDRMDVECLLFTDLLLICKANRRMDKYKIVKPPMRVDKIIVKELRDKGSFLVIYLNEYHIPVSAFTFHSDPSSIRLWIEHIRKAQDQYSEARKAASQINSQVDIEVEEQVIPCPPVTKELCQPMEINLEDCRESPDQFLPNIINGQSLSEQGSPTIANRSYSFSEFQKQDRTNSLPVAANSPKEKSPISETEHKTVQSSVSMPVIQQKMSVPVNGESSSVESLTFPASDIDMCDVLTDENMKVKLKERRTSRSEKRYHTADYIQDLNKQENKDTNIYKRLSWNFGTSDLSIEKEHSLQGKVMSSESFRSIYSSSGVSSNGSLHHPDPEVSITIEESDTTKDLEEDINEEIKDVSDMNITSQDDSLNVDDVSVPVSGRKHPKSKSVNDIEELLKELSTSEVEDGISSVTLPKADDGRKKLTHGQIMKMKKHLLLNSNIEASEV